VHRLMAAAMDEALDDIARIRREAREEGHRERPLWPMIVLRTPKGWTGPAEVDGVPVEGTFRSHQVPLAGLAERPDHLSMLEGWMRSYGPRELFGERGAPVAEIAGLAPEGDRRMSASPHANGGLLLRPLGMPDFRDYAVEVDEPGAGDAEATRVLGGLLRDVLRANEGERNFRLFGPDETESNASGRCTR
jgi:xylulose-5-phosphate/fructose-6-phosphate phosphoketolase